MGKRDPVMSASHWRGHCLGLQVRTLAAAKSAAGMTNRWIVYIVHYLPAFHFLSSNFSQIKIGTINTSQLQPPITLASSLIRRDFMD
jgi:hypothetical protein